MRSIRNKLLLLLPGSCNWFDSPFGKKDTDSEEYKKADKDAIGKEKCDAIENAIAKVNAEKQTTVIDEAKWESVVAELENAMIAAGLREKSEPSAFETAFTSLTRKMNIGLNKMF